MSTLLPRLSRETLSEPSPLPGESERIDTESRLELHTAVAFNSMNKRRKALVTGASSGIGKAVAMRFATDGYDVCLLARREPLLRELLSSLSPGDHFIAAGDYSDANFVEATQNALRERWGEVNALISCAGISMAVDVLQTPLREWQSSIDTMLGGAVRMSRMAADMMPSESRIIHITSIHGERVEAKASSYGIAKAAINQLCRSLALELAPRRILVNAIAPGFVRTPMSIQADGTNELETSWFRENYVEGHHLPLRRPAEPEEIAGVAIFLAGPDASYITGQILVVDGGLTITF